MREPPGAAAAWCGLGADAAVWTSACLFWVDAVAAKRPPTTGHWQLSRHTVGQKKLPVFVGAAAVVLRS